MSFRNPTGTSETIDLAASTVVALDVSGRTVAAVTAEQLTGTFPGPVSVEVEWSADGRFYQAFETPKTFNAPGGIGPFNCSGIRFLRARVASGFDSGGGRMRLSIYAEIGFLT